MGLRRRSATDGGDSTGAVARRLAAPLTPKRAKRLVKVATTVAPLVAPYLMVGASVLRARYDAYRAARLGVPPDQLGQLSGPGRSLQLRIVRVAEALPRLEHRAPANDDNGTTAAAIRPRLEDLSVAVRTAAQMPAHRRRTAFRAISAELDRIESEVLAALGVRS